MPAAPSGLERALRAPGASPSNPVAPTYGALLRVKGFPGLVVSQLLGRMAGQMLRVSLVLFVLARYHSPQLAGAATFLLLFPGLLLAPVAGALLDRHGRTRLITLDYLVAAAAMLSIAGLSVRHLLPPALLLCICGVASLTGPLSWAGLRSMFPSMVPGHLWERANALDTSSDVLATIVGAPIGGVLVGYVGGEAALAVAGILFALAGFSMLRVRDPSTKQRTQGILTQAWSGLVYVLHNRSLVGLALTFIVWGLGWGVVVIAMPVLVLGRLHQGAATVGLIWGIMGAAGFVAVLMVGRLDTFGRERQMMAVSLAAMAVAAAFLPLAGSIVVVAIALVIVAAVEAPFDIAFLTLRQRRTDAGAFGRMFAISMALNQLGSPLGSAVAGLLIAWSLSGALWVAVALVAAAAAMPLLTIPVREGPT
ncbi:MAG TPA: MFS transporter [Candidatus Dormibacteraeota bacterium]|nr:MFS transporter [Candidatus Dormibacteraeota bacterium]